MRDVTRLLGDMCYSGDTRGGERVAIYRSINILCDDVLENLRKATPCFIAGVWGKRANAEIGHHLLSTAR
jgi:hypothetical protein